MLTRMGRTIFFECDHCGEVLDTETSDFEEARECLMDYDWETVKMRDLWNHYCPACAEGFR